jgi:ABC-type polysaccharide transport system permease subunit
MNSTPVTTLQNQIIRKGKLKYSLSLTMIAVPFLIFIFIFSYVPLFGWIIAFFDYKPGMKFHQMTFIGLKYFKMAFSEGSQLPLVLKYFCNELTWTIYFTSGGYLCHISIRDQKYQV